MNEPVSSHSIEFAETLSLDNAKHLQYGDIVYYIGKGIIVDKSKVTKWRVNGKVKTWKRNPNRVKVPIKHGLHDYGYITHSNLSAFTMESLSNIFI